MKRRAESRAPQRIAAIAIVAAAGYALSRYLGLLPEGYFGALAARAFPTRSTLLERRPADVYDAARQVAAAHAGAP